MEYYITNNTNDTELSPKYSMSQNGSENVTLQITSLNGTFHGSFDQSSPFRFLYIQVLFGCLFSIVFLGCIVGNALVIFVIIKHQRMRNITNFFLANLAASDICVGAFCVIPNLMSFYTPYWYAGQVMCKLYFFMQCVSYTASIIILTVISMERYFAIIHPMLSKRLSRMALMRGIILVVWLAAIINGLPSLIAYNTVHVIETDGSNVQFCMNAANINLHIIVLVNFIILYCVPLLLISIMYTRISVALWRSSYRLDSTRTDSGRTLSGSKRILKLTKMHRLDVHSKLSETKQTGGDLANNQNHGGSKRTVLQISKQRMDVGSNVTETEQILCPQEPTSNAHRHQMIRQPSSEKNGTNIQCKRSLSTNSAARKNQCQYGSSSALTARRKVIRLLIAIVVSFAACMLPHHVRLLYEMWAPPNYHPTFAHHLVPPFSFLFFYLNSALNPILYAFLSDNFRNSLKEVFGCGRRKLPWIGKHTSQKSIRGTTTFQQSSFQ